MSTIKSDTADLVLNADGASSSLKIQIDGVEKSSISSAGAFTSTSIDATKLSGNLPALDGSSLTGVGVDGIVSTANATAITIDSSENVGIGVTPENGWHNSITALQVGGYGAMFEWGDMTYASNVYYDTGYKYLNTDEAVMYQQTGSGQHVFSVAPSATADSAISWTTAMTITNAGQVDFSPWSATGATEGLNINQAGKIVTSANSTASRNRVGFYNPNGNVGNIITSGSSTSYSTSSDYRLKNIHGPITDSIERVKSLNVYRFNFIADPTVTVDGFVAHEAGEVVPEAVSGEKDAMTTESYEITPAVEEVRDDDGNITVEAVDAVMGEREVIDPQGIDQSKLVPLLTSALQTALSQIEDLTARVEALEA